MKVNKLVLLALVLAAFAAGCQNTLSETSPALGDLNRAQGFEVGEASSPASFYPGAGDVSGSLSVTALAERKFIAVTFPDKKLDFLKTPNGNTANDFAAIEAKIKEFLHFYSLSAKTSEYQASGQTKIDYRVVRRDGRTITFELTGLTGSVSARIEVFIDSTKYTFSNGQKIDYDGNGKAGEAWFDDFYTYLPVTGATGTAAADIVQRNPRRGAGLAFRWKYGSAGTPGTPGNGGTFLTDNTGPQDLYLNISYDGFSQTKFNDTTDYSTAIGSMIVVEKYDRDARTYKEISLQGVSKYGTANDYHLRIPEIVPFDLLRVRVINDPVTGFKVGPYYGGEQRYYNTPYRESKNNTILELSARASTYESNPDTQFWTGAQVHKDANNANVSIILTLDSGVLGNRYLGHDLPEDFAKYFKIGYKNNTTSNISANPDSSWNDLTFVPIKLAAPRYSTLNPAANSIPDQLRIDLNPSFKIESGRLYVIIGNDRGRGFGYLGDDLVANPGGKKPGIFGNYGNVSLVIDGVSGFVNYGSITP
jgi:hypothetical protein